MITTKPFDHVQLDTLTRAEVEALAEGEALGLLQEWSCVDPTHLEWYTRALWRAKVEAKDRWDQAHGLVEAPDPCDFEIDLDLDTRALPISGEGLVQARRKLETRS